MKKIKLLPIEQVYWVQDMLWNSKLNFSAIPFEGIYAFINGDESWINRSDVCVDTLMCLEVELTIEGGVQNLIDLLEWCETAISYAVAEEYFELCSKLKSTGEKIGNKLKSCSLPEPFHESPLPAG